MSKLAEWHGSEFVIGDEYERDGKKIEYREVFSDLTPHPSCRPSTKARLAAH